MPPPDPPAFQLKIGGSRGAEAPQRKLVQKKFSDGIQKNPRFGTNNLTFPDCWHPGALVQTVDPILAAMALFPKRKNHQTNSQIEHQKKEV